MSADGTWKMTVNSAIGAQEATLEIVTSGDTFTGKMEGRAGAQEIAGEVAGATLTWTTSVTTPVPMTLEFTSDAGRWR